MNPVRILPRTKAESAASASLPANSVGILRVIYDARDLDTIARLNRAGFRAEG